jgi:hypothetical protein
MGRRRREAQSCSLRVLVTKFAAERRGDTRDKRAHQ